MSLMEREYMSDSYHEKIKNIHKYPTIKKQKDELWKLYGKKNKSFIDKWKIKRIEKSISKFYE